MKKILSLLLIFIMLFLCVGCNNESEPTEQPTQSSETLGQNDTQNKARALYVPNVEFSGNVEFIENLYTRYKYSFEELLENKTTTDVVVGTYLGAAYVIPNYYFFFKVDKLIKGEIHQETIAVCTNKSNYKFVISDSFEEMDCVDSNNIYGIQTLSNSSDLTAPYTTETKDGTWYYKDYREGHHYLLLLNRVSTPHLETEDLLMFTEDSIGIPVDKDGVPVVVSSKIYDTSLTANIKNEEIKQRVKNGELIDVILELTKDDVYQESSVNIVDKDTVLSNATYIINIEVCSQSNNYDNDLYSSYTCKIISVEKGDLGDEFVSIDLTDSKVKIGGKYTVALDENRKLISRNAIFPYTE